MKRTTKRKKKCSYKAPSDKTVNLITAFINLLITLILLYKEIKS